ncbi:MAG: SOS response-associated peptidase [Atribacter sp.]|uniref:SOS response-associated peptidase n=1 Tax=Atribacter sp. TaxID=2847780 RepID=UPI003D98B7C3
MVTWYSGISLLYILKLRYNNYMCGRFALIITPAELEKIFGLRLDEEFNPRYNIAPSQTVPVITYLEKNNKKKLSSMKWGLVPSWAKDPSIGDRMINARSETIQEKPSFRNAFQRRRALIPASGFFEWKREGTTKNPYFIGMKEMKTFAFAGLWERWVHDNNFLETFTILTTEANELVRPIHDRMPVIMPESVYDIWLYPSTDISQIIPLLAPYPENKMQAYPISKLVNNPKNDGPEILERVG